MSPIVEYLWKVSLAILFIHTVFVTGNDQTSDDTAVEKRRSPGFTHMFVGKRMPIELESRSPKYGYYFVGKRMPTAFQTRLSPKVGRWFVGKRPYAHRMFVGKREMEMNDGNVLDNGEDWENNVPYGDSELADGYYENKRLVNPFVYYALGKNKNSGNTP
ncbi:enterin neuropeptides-like [Haliotis rubra]|uniref:enterin neuropeptides-like n=1 Tax=Haliotis rubra TaxID=36100 RepID=UPI001EE53643|nr:enterin neuropeptides-like [Haliotis rubra]